MALAFVAGLALANHYTVGALAPLGLLATGRALRDSGRRPLVGAAGAAALLLGLAPYALLFGASGLGSDPATWSWGDVHDVRTLFAYLRRDEYADLHMASLDHVAGELIRVTVGLLGLPAVAAAALVKGLFTQRTRPEARTVRARRRGSPSPPPSRSRAPSSRPSSPSRSRVPGSPCWNDSTCCR